MRRSQWLAQGTNRCQRWCRRLSHGRFRRLAPGQSFTAKSRVTVRKTDRTGAAAHNASGRRSPYSVQDFFDDLAVVDLSTGEGEVQRTAFAIDSGMDFRRPAAAADADRLIFLPPF